MRDIGDGVQAPFIFTHLRFDILYNGDQVIHASVSGEKEVGEGPFCFVLFCFVLFCFVLFCFVLFCFVLFLFLFLFVLNT